MRTKIVSGYWTVYKLYRNYGGPEEGGWWYDSGVLIAAIPAERTLRLEFDKEEDVLISETFDDQEAPRPQIVLDLIRHLEDGGFGKFDTSELSSSHPKHEVLSLEWREELVTHFPSETPHYE